MPNSGVYGPLDGLVCPRARRRVALPEVFGENLASCHELSEMPLSGESVVSVARFGVLGFEWPLDQVLEETGQVHVGVEENRKNEQQCNQ